jgi:hypothetical protein
VNRAGRDCANEIIPGRVDHEIFCNECDEDRKNAWPEACIDAPGVDCAKLHESIGNTALKFLIAA